MANSDKNIVITPNIGQAGLPTLALTGQGNIPISLKVLDDAFGTISFQTSSGTQLFSVNNSTTGSIFSINDLSGLPVIDVSSEGNVDLAPYGGSVRVHGHNYIESANLTVTDASRQAIVNSNNGYIHFEISNNSQDFITNTNVMEINTSGEFGLRIKKRGILWCFVSHDIITSGNTGYAYIVLRVNGTPRGYHLITNTNGQWDGFTASQCFKVNSGDIFSINMVAADITSVDRGDWGKYQFLFHAV